MSAVGDPSALLERAYVDLDLRGGRLLDTAASPTEHPAEWRSVGDWLLSAQRIGAQRIFFVEDDPVLVFSALQPGARDHDILDVFRRFWSLARPRCLFLATGNELRVYALSQAPVSDGDAQGLTPLETVTHVADVAERLANFHRVRVESGDAFAALGDEQPHRADHQLLRDVTRATGALQDAGLGPRSAHRLIEQAILVRYLEDRGVLTPDYFTLIADQRDDWRRLLAAPTETELRPNSSFARCLSNVALTGAIFGSLATHFNGDLFVAGDDLGGAPTSAHLLLLQDLLLGTTVHDAQERMFLWAYDFSVVPTALVSTMYELFYNRERGRSSVYYTPPQLVEFVLADLLDERRLDTNPSICDPACGSGAFLVEAFRRLVRHRMARLGRPLSVDELKLLLGRLQGVDIDESAVRLAAFSLYVAYLHYQSPADILQAGRLPSLINSPDSNTERRPLTIADAFSPSSESPATSAPSTQPHVAWRSEGYDIVVGNPPWTKPGRGDSHIPDLWASRRALAVGDRNRSQLFIWRALDLLNDGGVASLLVAGGALTGVRGLEFRAQWLAAARLEHVVNFSEVRAAYFHDAAAPFALIRFRRAAGPPDGPVVYETAKRSGLEDSAPTYLRRERRLPSQRSLREHDHLWKTCMSGGLRDEALLRRLDEYGRLAQMISKAHPPGFGYQKGKEGDPSSYPPDEQLAAMPLVTHFTAWGPLELLPRGSVPPLIKRRMHPALYEGQRLIVGLGVIGGARLHARLEEGRFAYTHRTRGIPLQHRPRWEGQVALATLLSSVGRYWLFMHSRMWGGWKQQVRWEELAQLPLRLTAPDDPAVTRLVNAVERLPTVREGDDDGPSLFGGSDTLGAVLRDIDTSVGELFEMTDAERELVEDFWVARSAAGSRPVRHDGPDFGYADDVVQEPRTGIRAYLQTFLRVWNSQLGVDGEISWQLVRDRFTRVLCAIFETHAHGAPRARPDDHFTESWEAVLARIGGTINPPPSMSLRRYGSIRAVSDTAIVVIKRDEQRLWSATAAREDADATTVQAMALHEP